MLQKWLQKGRLSQRNKNLQRVPLGGQYALMSICFLALHKRKNLGNSPVDGYGQKEDSPFIRRDISEIIRISLLIEAGKSWKILH